MIAIAASILVALYLIIPALLSRFIYRLFVPLRIVAGSNTEEGTRAVTSAIFPFLLALFVVWYIPGLNRLPIKAGNPELKAVDYKLVVSCLYSESIFTRQSQQFWQALDRTVPRQVLFLSWYYLLTTLTALGLGFLTAAYGQLGSNRYYRWFTNKFLFPRISEWHPLFTSFVFADKQTVVRADVLTTTDNLYRGKISEHFIDNSGGLTGLILTDALRFDRRSYLQDLDTGKEAQAADYWKEIPGAKLYMFADKIVNLNLNYESANPPEDAFEKFLLERLKRPVRIEISHRRKQTG